VYRHVRTSSVPLASLLLTGAALGCSASSSSAPVGTTGTTRTSVSIPATATAATAGTTPSPSSGSVPLLPARRYEVDDVRVDATGRSMIVHVRDSCGDPRPGDWRVDLRNAGFGVRSQPATGMGHTDEADFTKWAVVARSWPNWHVEISSERTWVTNGANAGCENG
jgi:hypothetical protein